jgi:hypothetical protein
MKMPSASALYLAGGLALAGTSGALGAVAVTSSGKQAPTKTVTINAGTGETGPQGPAGPAGPAGPPGPAGTGGGAESCPTGSSFGAVVINSPSGHVEIWTCVKNT